MKRIFISMLMTLLVGAPAIASAAMDSYCSAPAYVTRTVAPNIMVVIDNSPDMLTAAYTGAYDPAVTYVGYFTPTACYSYSSKFQEDTTHVSGTPCPSTAPYRGNLMNWATMSKYDVVQKVLIGGNSVSKQAHANTLVGIGGLFADKTYGGCRFQVDNANLVITEDTVNACSLLDATPTPIAQLQLQLPPADQFVAGLRPRSLGQIAADLSPDAAGAWSIGGAESTIQPLVRGSLPDISDRPIPTLGALLDGTVQWPTAPASAAADLATLMAEPVPAIPPVAAGSAPVAGGDWPLQQWAAAAAKLWQGLDFPSKAWAAACPAINVGALDASLFGTYTLILTGDDSQGGVNTWREITLPAWLTRDTPNASHNSYKVNGSLKGTNVRASWTGSPPTVGNHHFEIAYSSTTGGGCDEVSVAADIVVAAPTLVIDTPSTTTTSLPAGTVGELYAGASGYLIQGRGGIPDLSWSVSNLPPGMFISSSVFSTDTGVLTANITGTPTVAGTYSVAITLIDSSAATANQVKTVELVINSSDLAITTNALPGGQETSAYSASMAASGGTAPYVWSITDGSAGLTTAGVSMDAAGVFSGTFNAGSQGAYSITVAVTDSIGTVVTKDFTITVVPFVGYVRIFSTSPLPTAYSDTPYTYQMEAAGGTKPYKWYIVSGAPAGNPAMTISEGGVTVVVDGVNTYPGGVLSWTPTNNADQLYENIVIKVIGAGGHEETMTFSVTSLRRVPPARAANFNVKVDIKEEDLTDLNGNDVHDDGEVWDDTIAGGGNANGVWDGKQGIFQQFWDSVTPKARWGMTKFTSHSTEPEVATCIPASPVASWYTGLQNATPADAAPLVGGLYGAINYYGFNSPYGDGFSGCLSSDPIDNIPCRKNFILLLSSGSNRTGDAFASGTSVCAQTDELVRNACVGYNTDLRPDAAGTQNVKTFVVNTMGDATASASLAAAAAAGGGEYYDASNPTGLEASLKKALQDILGQAASGTAVSVLTTSSRGIGSMMQAYFLPIRQEGSREVGWTGYVQNIWIDPSDNLREDTVADYKLKLTEDHALRLYFDNNTNQTKAAIFDEEALANCSGPEIKDFSEVAYTWEGGAKLAKRVPSTRQIFTSKKVIKGAATTFTFAADSGLTYPKFKTTMDATLLAALDPAGSFTTDNIVKYVRGECLESGVSGDTACGATGNGIFRDRRVTIDGGAANGNVWKLGDVISSTPKVLSNTPNNTYHIDYGDSSYYAFVSADPYKKRSALAFVGANDGMLHAFRVGYLKDKNLTDDYLGIFKNTESSADDETGHTAIGEEVWGYIPFNAFPYLKYLADPAYCHIYFNDLSVRLVDASLGCSADNTCDEPTEARKTASWKTILVGGMRYGGACEGSVTPAPPMANVGYSSYYALDVTDAEHPIPLWEFSDPDMGYATSFPSVVRTGATSTNGNWYVVVGSGSTQLPKSGTDRQDMARTTPGYLYVLDLKTGEMVKKITLDHNAIVGDVLTIDQDKNYASEKLYFGTSYNASGVWKGKLVSLTIPNQDLAGTGAALWTPAPSYLFTGDYPFTASPDATRDVEGKVWLYAGSGKYLSDLDEDTTETQVFLGLKDLPSGVTYPVTTTDLANRTGIVTTGTVSGTAEVCGFDPGTGTFGMQTVVTSTNQTSTVQTTPAVGWYVLLANGERVISRPLAVGGLVDFLTYQPSSDACSYGGNSYLYALDYTTGVAPASVAIRTSETTERVTTMEAPVNIASRVLLGPGAPPTGEAIIVPPPKEGSEQLKKKIQVATGVIVEAENTPVLSVISKIVHWLKK